MMSFVNENGKGAAATIVPDFVNQSFRPIQMGSMTKTTVNNSNCNKNIVWNLTTVPILPDFHTLVQTAVFVPKTITIPSEVATRISNVLRERSIQAQYNNDKAKATCMTADGVLFRIYLYQGRGRYNHGIIVEVVREFGMSFVFHSDTVAILDGAKTNTALSVSPLPSPLPSNSETNMSNNLPKVTDDEEGEDYNTYDNHSMPNVESSLTMVSKMMTLPGFDSQYLGLKTLLTLVDSDKLSLSTAQAVAVKIFQENNEVGMKVIDYIINNQQVKNKGRKNKGYGVLFDDDDDEDDNCFSIILRNTCLNILANAMKANIIFPENLRDSLLPVLLRDLKDAEKSPNAAYFSAKCMKYFVTFHNEEYSFPTSEINEVFEVAKKIGKKSYANLMQ